MATAVESQTLSPDWTHILVETSSLDDIRGALRGSSRLKYTCIDVSSKFLVLGSNTGSVYVFGKSSQKHPQIIFPEIDPAHVNCVSISPTDKAVAFSTVRGHVIVVELSTDRRQKPERLRMINDHLQSTVTCITWDTTGSKLYTADSAGRTFVTSIQSSKVQNLVSLTPEVILKLDSPICQVDISEDNYKLLVSTLNKCYLCYTTRQKFTHIGTKPRDGEYGACFYRQPNTGLDRIYCARPGSRIWEVDIDCNVLHTHMFKQLLACPALPLVSSVDYSWTAPSETDIGPKGLAFPKLKTTSEHFLYTWCKNNLYIFDPVKVKVIFWTDLGSEIQNVVSSDGYLFVFYFNGSIQKTKIFQIPECVSFLIAKKSWVLAAEICTYFHAWIVKMRWKKYLSVADIEKLKNQCKGSGNDSLATLIDNMISLYPAIQDSGSELEDSFSDRSRSSSTTSIQKLESGIYRINSQNSLLFPDIMSIPEDLQKGATSVDNPLLKNLQSEIIDLIDHTSHEVVSEKSGNEMRNGTLANGTRNVSNTNEASDIVYNREDSETDVINDLVNTNNVLDNLQDGEHIGTKITLENGEQHFDQIKNKTVSDIMNNDPLVLSNSDIIPDNEISESQKSMLQESINGINIEVRSESESTLIDEVQDQGSESRILQNNNPELLDHQMTVVIETVSEEDLKPVVAMTTHNVSPLVSPGSQTKKKQKKKKSVNEIVLEDDLNKNNRKGMRRTKSMGSISKTTEKKLQHKHSFTEPLFEENNVQPTDVITEQGVPDLAADSKSLGDGSLESSPGSSLAHSWESTGSEMVAGLRKKSLTSKIDSVQSKLTTTKNKFLKAIRHSKLSRSPGREGKTTPDTLSLDSMDGIIIFADKVQKDLVDLAPIVKSPIDLSDLQKSTDETRKLLQDINIVLNPIELQKTLSDWIKHLNQSLCQLHTAIYIERLRKFHTCSKENIEDIKQDITSDEINNDCNENINNSGIGSSKVNNEDHSRVQNIDTVSSGSSQSENSSPNLKHLVYLIEEDNLDFESICHVSDPYLMATDFQQNVAELTQMCFDSGCYGDIFNFIFPSHKQLGGVELCEKCKEMLDIDKICEKKLSDFNQRDSGFIENDEKRRNLEESNTEKLVVKCDNFESKQNDALEIKSDKKQNMGDCTECDKNTNKNGLPEVNDNEEHKTDHMTDYDNHDNQIDKLLIKDDDVSEDLDSLPLCSSNSDQSVSNTSEGVQDLSSLSNDFEIKPSEIHNKEETISDHDQSEPKNENNDQQTSHLKHQSCFNCNQADIICFHGNRSNEEISEIQRFVHVHFSLLDFEKVKNKAYCCEEPSYEVWSGLVKSIRECCRHDVLFIKMEQDISTATEVLRLGEFQQSKTLGYLSRLFEINPKKAIDVCIGSSTVYPLDVLYFCDLHSLPVDRYFYNFMKAKVTESDGYKLYDNILVVQKWIEILLASTNHQDKFIDQNGNPRPWSHLEKWNDQEIIDHVISVSNEKLIEHHLRLCKQTGYWNGYLVLLKRQERFFDMLITILHLQDVKLLDLNEGNGTLPSTIEEWKWFLGQFSSIHNQNSEIELCSSNMEPSDPELDHNTGNSFSIKPKDNQDQSHDHIIKGASWDTDEDVLKHHTYISWDDIGQLMLQNLGPVTTVQLIQDCGCTEEMFSLLFFQSCILSSFIHRQQRNVTHSLLEKLDSYLWTKKPNTLMPEEQVLCVDESQNSCRNPQCHSVLLQYLVCSEKEGSADDTKEDHQDGILYLTSDQSLVSKQYREDMESHWGTSTKINRTCKNCNIQLTETVSHVEPGVLVFPCGHGFHKFCCPLRECILCMDFN